MLNFKVTNFLEDFVDIGIVEKFTDSNFSYFFDDFVLFIVLAGEIAFASVKDPEVKSFSGTDFLDDRVEILFLYLFLNFFLCVCAPFIYFLGYDLGRYYSI
jgi:hypothetical protein